MNASLLELRQITVSFDGFLALRDLNLSLQPGELRAVIGPNGAGKTTFLDVITGKTAPTEGDVLFKGSSLVGASEHRIARLGIGRKFQSPRVFEKLSVQQNLALQSDQAALVAVVRLPHAGQRDQVHHLMSTSCRTGSTGCRCPSTVVVGSRSTLVGQDPDLLLLLPWPSH